MASTAALSLDVLHLINPEELFRISEQYQELCEAALVPAPIEAPPQVFLLIELIKKKGFLFIIHSNKIS